MAQTPTVDELTTKLIVDGKKIEDVLMMSGFVGKGTDENTLTFYFDPLLKNSIVIQISDILHSVQITETHSVFGGTIIWIKNAAAYQHSNHQNPQSEAAQFFQGEIYQQYVNTAQGNPSPQQPQKTFQNVCGCGKCG